MDACYFVHSYTLTPKRALLPELPLSLDNRDQAVRLAARLLDHVCGVVVIERRIDAGTGELADGHIVFNHGLVPDEISDIGA